MAIRIIKEKTEKDDELLKRFLKKRLKGTNITNKDEKERIGDLISKARSETDNEETIKYLDNLYNYLYPVNAY